jgi:hypothetical protein
MSRPTQELTKDDVELLTELKLATKARHDAIALQDRLVFVARDHGITWAHIAEALGVTIPSAHGRYKLLEAKGAI